MYRTPAVIRYIKLSMGLTLVSQDGAGRMKPRQTGVDSPADTAAGGRHRNELHSAIQILRFRNSRTSVFHDE
jgi:hypothetical protein